MSSEAWSALNGDPRVQCAAGAPMLQQAHERELLARAQRGDRAAVQALVESHMRMVLRAAARCYRPGLAVQDLISEGVLGLLMAIARFNPEYAGRLCSYADWWVRAQVQNFANENRGIVAPPTTRGVRVARHRAGYVRRELAQRLQREPSHHEVASVLGISPADVEVVEQLRGRDVSLCTDEGSELWERDARDDRHAEERLGSEQEAEERRSRVQRTLARLPPRERCIVEEHLLADEPRALGETARALQISRQRVGQILARLRHELASELRDLAC